MPLTPQTFVDIPINKGTQPDWQRRFGYPLLLNYFVGESDFVYTTPSLFNLSPDAPFDSVRAIHYTRFNGGMYIVVTKTSVYRLFSSGAYQFVATIIFSGQSVQIDENLQEQVIIVDGARGYVFDQHNNIFVTLTQAGNGFGLKNPISVVVINTIAIILDGETDSWIISEPNNALNYPALDTIPKIESQLTKAVSVQSLENNLYILGTTGIERWEPTIGSNSPYIFPFIKDNNFRSDYGALATNAVVRGASGNTSKIYFYSSQYLPMALTANGIIKLPMDGNMTGMARITSQYPDVNEVATSFFNFRGNYFCAFTFASTGISWVYTENSGTWFQSDDIIISAVANNEVVATPDGVFKLSLIRTYKHRRIVTERITKYKGPSPYRNVLNQVEARVVQGQLQTTQPQYLELTISLDSESWLNTVPRQLGFTGRRNAIVTWGMNIAAYEYTLRFDYYGDLDLSFEKITAKIT